MIKISCLLASRKRPDSLLEMWNSLVVTADDVSRIELLVYIDSDDTLSLEKLKNPPENFHVYEGERGVLSGLTTKLLPFAAGDIFYLVADDIRMRTFGWDSLVLNEFAKFPDKIAMVHGHDGIQPHDFATHFCLHRNWTNTLGYLLPPYFPADFGDTWIVDVANMLGRRRYIPMYNEHMHHRIGKSSMDETYQEARVRAEEFKVAELYATLYLERCSDVEKLRKFIHSFAN